MRVLSTSKPPNYVFSRKYLFVYDFMSNKLMYFRIVKKLKIFMRKNMLILYITVII